MMNPYIKKVKPLENYCLMLWFENGEQKIFDLNPYLNKDVFNQLKNTSLFASVEVVAGSVEWSNGIDLSYDTLYLEGLATNLVAEANSIPFAEAAKDLIGCLNGLPPDLSTNKAYMGIVYAIASPTPFPV